MAAQESFEGWAILELMGHRRLAGRVSEQLVAGAPLIRIDVPNGDGFTTQFYAPGALYALTPTDEATARRVAASPDFHHEPVRLFKLRGLPEPPRRCESCQDAIDDAARDKYEPDGVYDGTEDRDAEDDGLSF